MCLHALYGDYSCSGACDHCFSLLTFKTICNSITNYSLYKMFQHRYERYLKGCCRAIRCFAFFFFFFPTVEHMVPTYIVFIWVQQSSNIFVGTFILCTLCKFKGEWIMLIPFSFTVWAQLFSFSPLEPFFFLILCWCAPKYSVWLAQCFLRLPYSFNCLGGQFHPLTVITLTIWNLSSFAFSHLHLLCNQYMKRLLTFAVCQDS